MILVGRRCAVYAEPCGNNTEIQNSVTADRDMILRIDLKGCIVVDYDGCLCVYI